MGGDGGCRRGAAGAERNHEVTMDNDDVLVAPERSGRMALGVECGQDQGLGRY